MIEKKILILSTSDTRGAYEAAYRIARFLFEDGYEVALLVKDKTRNEKFIHGIKESKFTRGKRLAFRVLRHLFKKKIAKDGKYLFLDEDESRTYTDINDILKSIPFIPNFIVAGMMDNFCNTKGLLELKKKTNADIYSITVDMSPLTGGCHYAWDCLGYTNDCKNCPAILDLHNKDWAHKNLSIKKRNAEEGNFGIIAGSGWTLLQAQKSTLYRHQREIYSLAGCVDTRTFNDKNRDVAKKIFGIDNSYKVIFCGSQHIHDERKGFKYFLEALNILKDVISAEISSKICILVIGNNTEIINSIPFKSHVVDFITDYRLLALAYQAADVFVCASIEDSGPLMVSEALASGTPVVGFEMGIVYDMVVNDYNGYKAELRNSKDLAIGLAKILSLSQEKFSNYSKNAIDQVDQFSSYKTVLDVFRRL